MLVRTILLALLITVGPPVQRKQLSTDCFFVARVNNDIITREVYSKRLTDHREEVVRRMEARGKSRDIDLEFERTKASVLDQMIDESLLEQKAKELGLETDSEVTEVINDPDSGISAGYADRIPTEDLAEGPIDWERARSRHRRMVLRDAVIYREVLVPVYQSISDEDRRDYYNSHKDEFKLEGKVSLSEVFLPFEGNSEAQTEIDARRLQMNLRGGADFVKAVIDHTPPSRASRANRGSLGSFSIRDLKPSVATAVSSLIPGDVSEPVRFDYGYVIYRLDAITRDSVMDFDDPRVQEKISRSITMSLAETSRKQYIAQLRKTARIEVCSAGL